MELNRVTAVCFTGHRLLPAERREELEVITEEQIRRLICRGFDTFITGGARGFDTMAHHIVCRIRDELPFIRLVMAIPCADQAEKWREEERFLYEEMRQRTDEEIVLAPRYTDGCMLARNRFMVDHSSVVVACRFSEQGGTAYTVRYANRVRVPVINVWTKLSGL